MHILNKKESILLLLGDIVFFLTALWLALAVRHFEVPTFDFYLSHVVPFSFVFVVWVSVFFIAGLYEKHTLFLKSRLPSIILNAQIANSIIAVLFFYFIPYFGITPKTVLFIDLIFSFGFILLWRLYLVPFFGFRKKQKALLIGSGAEMKELKAEVNGNSAYSLQFVSSLDLEETDGVDFQEEILNVIYTEGVSTIVVDLNDEKIIPILPHLYNLIFSRVHFIDINRVYEDIFNRVPLDLINYHWFLEHSTPARAGYAALKRVLDIVVSFLAGLISLAVYPFVALAIKLDDRGPVFFKQERIGKNNKHFMLTKFRTMSSSAETHEGTEPESSVTRVGDFLRKTRIDELPQLWNVLAGDLSLIGPRPELPHFVSQYEKEILYYRIRHIAKPGLSGWAQIYHEQHPHHGIDVRETKHKLSYDLYYLKNRSFMLDIVIVLKTLKVLFSRSGK